MTVSRIPTRQQEYENARRIGREDAKDGRGLCLPELYFGSPALQVAYIRGFEAQMGVQTLLSRQAMRIAAEKIARGVK